MKNFVFRFLFISVVCISTLFYALIFFQKRVVEDNFMPPPSSGFEQPFERNMPPKEPPIFIPLFFIVSLSSIFMYLILKNIEKNFVKPLINIEDKVKTIKDGSLNVTFETVSENETIKDTYKTLNEMVQELKQKEKLQDNFIQDIAHDLRVPVLAQERAFDILNEEFKDNELISALAQNNESYLNLVNTIIEVFNKREIKIEKIEFNLKKLLASIIEVLSVNADEKNIKIENNVEDDFTLFADYISVNRVLMNLLSNAIDNIGDDKLIKINAKQDNDKTIIIIEDNGQGMEDTDKIFAKYNYSKRKSISGLGLSIVKDLVEKNGGKILAESKIEEYTKFTIELLNRED